MNPSWRYIKNIEEKSSRESEFSHKSSTTIQNNHIYTFDFIKIWNSTRDKLFSGSMSSGTNLYDFNIHNGTITSSSFFPRYNNLDPDSNINFSRRDQINLKSEELPNPPVTTSPALIEETPGPNKTKGNKKTYLSTESDIINFGELMTNHKPNQFISTVIVSVLGVASKLFMHHLNRTTMYDTEKFEKAVETRKPGQGLITVSNHVSALDDPLVTAAMLPVPIMFDHHQLRWTFCATDQCFTNAFTTHFFKYVKVLPVTRGGGIDQPGLTVGIQRLNEGKWIHYFPEGTRTRDGHLKPVRIGIGKLIVDPEVHPVVIPFFHRGMDGIIPVGSYLPQINNKIDIIVGDPLDFSDLIEEHKKRRADPKILYIAIARRIQENFVHLSKELERREMEKV